MPPKPRDPSIKSIAVVSHKKTDPNRVATPGVSNLPECLKWSVSATALPPALIPEDMTSAQPFFSALERVVPELQSSAKGAAASSAFPSSSRVTHDRCWTGLPESDIRSFAQEKEEDAYRWMLEDKEGIKRPVFLKRAHLLDPMDAMSGSYLTPKEGGLPAPSGPWLAALKKLNDPLNEAYVDALFALYADKMVLNGVSPHWCRCYGTYTARASSYLYDITEEYDSLKKESWWHKHQRQGLFSIIKDDAEDLPTLLAGAESALDDGDFEAIEDDTPSGAPPGRGQPGAPPGRGQPGAPVNVVEYTTTVGGKEEPTIVADPPMKLRTPKIRFTKVPTDDAEPREDDSEDDGEDSSSEGGEDFNAQYAEFHDFPVQVTLLERATQTLEDLCEDETGTLEERNERWSAWLFQIVAALATAQHYFGFVHNDLHSNNVMWSPTSEEYFHYRVHKGKETYIMKVPTFGKVMKIIDFGRASYTLPGCGFFISDAFYPGNDAAEQYNCEPFYNAKEGPKLEPNPSFDLCRLAVSLLDSLFPERPPATAPVTVMSREKGKLYTTTTSPVYNLLWEWLLDDEGQSVLRTPEGEERYPEFDLYCALAADVHRAVPKRQIEKAVFAKYKATGATAATAPDTPIYNLYI